MKFKLTLGKEIITVNDMKNTKSGIDFFTSH
jgi:hypothetical protein